MMKIFNQRVYGLKESLIRSRYPKSTSISEDMGIDVSSYEFIEGFPQDCSEFKRGVNLGNTKGSSGHDCFLKGIIVQMDICAPQYWWQQAQRYHWFEIISSQSKMHKILEMDLYDSCGSLTYFASIDFAIEAIEQYKNNEVKFEEVLSNLPMGLEYTAGISTNYLQLKSMYYQRKTHRLSQWKYFCEWCEGLPYFKELCLGGNK